ncbi:MAG TPA: Ig-like domain-containing protein [Arachnia sp.]|nr:Ig-like domain-containing protein [Arachnia sp.]HMT85795.1 Ig-like domain-containing protein [Arachnia sp.]
MERTRLLRRPTAMVAASVLVAGLIPLAGMSSAYAALPTSVAAAAYLGADELSETSLPATLSDGTADHPVTWSFDEETFAVPYATVQVPGTADGQQVTAHVEVLPPAEHPLVYFVDAGRNGDSQTQPWSTIFTPSKPFDGAKSLAQSTLHNTLPDQRFVSGTNDWGHVFDATNNYKISVTGGDPNAGNLGALADLGKFELGVRTNGTQIGFRLALEAGTYTLSSGFFEFYTGSQARSRGIRPTVSYLLDGQTVTTPLDNATLTTPSNAPSPRLISTSAFTIPEGASNIALSYVRTSGEAPSLSWFAIAEGDAVDVIRNGLAPTTAIQVDIDANLIAAQNKNGLTFKGFGVLSANSTSAVLMDYKSHSPEKYNELLEILFGGEHPIMQHVKIEMGNDRNNSTGPDPATMRTETEPANVTRHPGFQLAADAYRINPDLKVSILRWNPPAWANNNDKIYTWYKNTILAAYREYGYMVDYVNPGINEHSADLTWTKEFTNRVRNESTGYVSSDPALAGFRPGEQALFRQIKTVISDEVGIGTFGGSMVSDAALRDAVAVSAFHYNTNDDSAGNFTRLAQEFDQEIWNSEAQATFSNSSFRPNNNAADPTVAGTGLGGTGSSLEMANTIVKGYVNSRRTHFIYQPAIGSFYEGGQYSFKELVSARDPWSGWIHYDAGLAVIQHFANFAVTGWENDDNTAGIWRTMPSASMTTATGTNPVNGRNGLPNYMTMAAPDKSDFSTVIVNDSEKELTYRLAPRNFTFPAGTTLDVWETRAAGAGQAVDANYKKRVATLSPNGAGNYLLTVKPFSIVTVTSLDVTGDEGWTTPLPVEGERTVLDDGAPGGVLWADDFDYTDLTVPVIAAGGGLSGDTEDFIASRGGDVGTIPLFSWDRNGAFEAYLTPTGERVLRQQIDNAATGVGGAWNGGDPVTGIGDRRWTNYQATVDVKLERATTSGNYAVIGVRSSGGGSSNNLNGTGYALRLYKDGSWNLLRMGTQVGSGTVGGGAWNGDAWHKLSLRATGATITGFIDNQQVVQWTDETPFLSGFADLASGFHFTQFDNFEVKSVDGWQPYYGEYLDNLEMHDLSPTPVAKLVYNGQWSHTLGGGMFEYHRTKSATSSAGAGVSYTFTGSGLDILGGHDGTARLRVFVDGDLVAANARTKASGQFQASYTLRGLPWGQHTVRVEVVSGSYSIDAIGTAAVAAQGVADTGALAAALAVAEDVERDDEFTDVSWEVLQTAIAHAQAAVADPAAYRLDGHGAEQLTARLLEASAPVAGQIQSLPTVTAATYVGEQPSSLPSTLTATMTDGSTQQVPIHWNLTGVDLNTPWATVAVTGSYGSATTTAWVEVVPRGTVAFADVNGTQSALGFPSPAYTAINELVGGTLLNELPDRLLPAGGAWGHFGRNAAGTSVTNYKGVVAGPYSKLTTTGLYASDAVGSSVGYTFTLPAGEHTIAAGSHSWWPGNARTANVTLTYGGQTHTVDQFTLNTATPSRVLSYDIELAEPGTVTLTLTSTNAQSPMLSWVGVSTADEQVAEPVVTVVPTTRCVAGKVVLAVTATNGEDSPLNVAVSSPYGSRTFAGLAGGASSSAAFTTRLVTMPAGQVDVSVTVPGVDGAFTSTVPYAGKTC